MPAMSPGGGMCSPTAVQIVEKVSSPLTLEVSDGSPAWKSAAVLEDEPTGQYSYPAVIQSSDGLIHVVYTWKRLKIKHAGGRSAASGTERDRGGFSVTSVISIALDRKSLTQKWNTARVITA
jgi:hypothetical protein